MTDQSAPKPALSSNIIDLEQYRARIAADYPDKAQQDEALQILWNIAAMAVRLSWDAQTIPTLFKSVFEKASADSDTLSESGEALNDKRAVNE